MLVSNNGICAPAGAWARASAMVRYRRSSRPARNSSLISAYSSFTSCRRSQDLTSGNYSGQAVALMTGGPSAQPEALPNVQHRAGSRASLPHLHEAQAARLVQQRLRHRHAAAGVQHMHHRACTHRGLTTWKVRHSRHPLRKQHMWPQIQNLSQQIVQFHGKNPSVQAQNCTAAYTVEVQNV